MDSLPYDILVHVFQFLPLTSRNQIRKVCKKWNDACSDPIIIKRERFRIHRSYDSCISDVFATLAESKRSIINLKFDRFDYDTESFSWMNFNESFWENHGTKVKYLEFTYCNIISIILARILMNCPNLTELHCYGLEDEDFTDVVKKFFDNNVIFEKVTYLCLRDSSAMSTASSKIDIIEALRKIFPNVQKLNIDTYYGGGRNSSDSRNPFLDAWNYVLTISSDLRYLELGFEPIDFVSSNLPKQELLTKILAAAKQTRILWLPRIHFLTQNHIFQLRDLKALTTFCFNAENTGLTVCDALVKVLDNVPKLRHFEVTQASEFGQISHVAEKLVSSSLRTLIIDTKLNDGDCIEVTECPCNYTLETLHFNFSVAHTPENMFTFFIKHFPNLRNLSFKYAKVSSAVLEDIRKYQKNLNGLKVIFDTDSKISMETPDAQWFSFHQFQYLEHLNLSVLSWFSKQYSFSNFVLPQLKYLKIRLHGDMDRDHPEGNTNLVNFLCAIEKLPCLELLTIFDFCEEIPYDLVLRQCESHKNLQYLTFVHTLPFNRKLRKVEEKERHELEEKLRYLFRVRESLRFVSHEYMTLHRNIITKKIVVDYHGAVDFIPL